MRYFRLILLLCLSCRLFAQPTHGMKIRGGKPALDTSLFFKWPSVSSGFLSSDGRYASYRIDNRPVGSGTTVFQQISGQWKREFPGVVSAAFTSDSRKAVFIQIGDSLCLLDLGGVSQEYIGDVEQFRLFQQGETQWLACQLNKPTKALLLRNLKTGRELTFPDVEEYLPNQDGSALVIKREQKTDTRTSQTLEWVELSAGNSKVIWEGAEASNLVLDGEGQQLAFIAETSQSKTGGKKSGYYYKRGGEKAEELIHPEIQNFDIELKLGAISRFSGDGSLLFISYQGKESSLVKRLGSVAVDVWNYQDVILQSEQLTRYDEQNDYQAVMRMSDRKLTQLQGPGEFILQGGPQSDEALFVNGSRGDPEEMHWSRAARPSCWMVSTRTGERKYIEGLYGLSLSPNGAYVIGYEYNRYTLCSYEVSTGKIANLSNTVPVPLFFDDGNMFETKNMVFGDWWWDPSKILVYDSYDLWLLDLTGKDKPVCLTLGFGRKNNIELRLADKPDQILKDQSPLLLRALNLTTKQEGFYRFLPGKQTNPEFLSMGPYSFKMISGVRYPWIQASKSETFLVMREAANQSPNYYWTKDFKEFGVVSQVYPESSYNWLQSELINFRALNGLTSQGVVYRPEDFDSTRKYPVIIQYYEKKSGELNNYRSLFDEEAISIPWFTSHGYVVFTPDIHYRMRETGQCAYEAIMGAANYLDSLPWVDTAHLGLEGHSFGGFETNYLITHSSRFAAAISSSGVSDAILEYGDLWGGSNSKQGYVESRQGRMGGTLWDKPAAYLENSPIFRADKITTPVLLLANKDDGNVSFKQGLMFFLALRRLGKRAWLLQYDGQGHGVGGRQFVDFTLRSQQFLDHYLRDAPAPHWMVKGIPARMKTVDDGIKLKSPGIEPGPGLPEGTGISK